MDCPKVAGVCLKSRVPQTFLGKTCFAQVVVHLNNGTLVKGLVECGMPGQLDAALRPLPDVLAIERNDVHTPVAVRLADVKAVFFVRDHHGDVEHQDLKFFDDDAATELWVQLRLADGETLEGRVVNSLELLASPGLWLWPADAMANNSLIYVPKSSIVGFRITGLVHLSIGDAFVCADDQEPVDGAPRVALEAC